jgi:hypothetical protein
MKNQMVYIISFVLSVSFLFFYACNCKHFQKNTSASKYDSASVELEKDTIIKIAQDAAVKLYGYNIIQNELPLMAKLKNDSIWVITGTLAKGVNGGTVYVEILRKEKKVVTLTHYK